MDPELYQKTKEPNYKHIARTLYNVATAFSYAGKEDPLKNSAVNSVTDITSPTITGAFDEYSSGSVTTPNFAYDLHDVRNQHLHQTYVQDVKDAVREMDTLIDKATDRGDFGKETGEVMKAFSTSPVRRELEGKSDAHLAMRTPLANTYASTFGASLKMTADKEMDSTMKKWGKTCPIWDLVVESEKQMDLLGNYFKDKDAGKLTPEKEADYRKKLLAQVTDMQEKAKKVDKAVSDPKTHAELKADKVFQNDPFHLHSLSARGQASLTASLDAYKKGLENGWAIEDLGVLASYNAARVSLENSLTTNQSTDLKNFKKDTSMATPKKTAFLSDMNALYEEMTKTKLAPGSEKRDQYMNQMKEMVARGEKEKVFADNVVPYFNMIHEVCTGKTVLTNDREVQQKREQEKRNDQLENQKNVRETLNELRKNYRQSSEGIDPKNESPEHKEYRLAVEKLNKVLRVREQVAGGDRTLNQAQADKLMEQTVLVLDDVIYQAQKYAQSGADKKVKGAEARQEGLDSIKSLAKNLLNPENMEQDSRKLGISSSEVPNPEEIRKKVATRRSEAAEQKMANMKMPSNTAELKEFMLCAADVLVGKIANSDRRESRDAVEKLGVNALKSNILDDKHFRNLIKDYIKDKSMTPAKVVAELKGNAGVRKLQEHAPDAMKEKQAKQAKQEAKMTKQEKNRQKETEKLTRRVHEGRLGR